MDPTIAAHCQAQRGQRQALQQVALIGLAPARLALLQVDQRQLPVAPPRCDDCQLTAQLRILGLTLFCARQVQAHDFGSPRQLFQIGRQRRVHHRISLGDRRPQRADHQAAGIPQPDQALSLHARLSRHQSSGEPSGLTRRQQRRSVAGRRSPTERSLRSCLTK